MSLNHRKKCCWLIALGLLAVYLAGCNREPAAKDLLLGQWRFERRKVHTILSFRANGSWTAQVRTEGRLQKIVEKKGSVIGKYTVVDDQIEMTPTKVPVDIGWKEGQTVVYKISELTPVFLRLSALSGKETLYKRIRSQKQGQEKIVQTIKLEPIIVNLNKGEVLVKDRFLCLYLELIQEPPSGQSRVHPRVREALIMHLSSLTYPEVNTYRKLNRLSGELIDLINPYMGGTVKDLVIQNVVVTADEAAVQEFLALFDPANQKNAGEKKSRD